MRRSLAWPLLVVAVALSAGCGLAHDAANLEPAEVQLSESGTGWGMRGRGSDLLDAGLEALPVLLPYAEQEAREDRAVHYRVLAMAIMDRCTWDSRILIAHGVSDTDLRLTPLDARALRVIDAALRSQQPKLRTFARRTLSQVADARLFAASVEDVARAVAAAPAAGLPYEVQDATLALGGLAVENGRAVRPRDLPPSPGGGVERLAPAWVAVFTGQVWTSWSPARGREVVEGLRTWLQERQADLPEQVLAEPPR
ncbi:MAG: hypothetical protein AB7N76_14920 [Planctomycetota bacterium]